MKIPFHFIICVFLFPSVLAAEPTCVISYAGEDHRDILKAIVTRVVLDSAEFDDVKFIKAKGNLAEHDLVIKKEIKNQSFDITPRLRFSDGYPTTWQNVDKLNGHLTVPILSHLDQLHNEKKKSLRDVVDIFIGSLNWSRLQEQNSTATTLGPASESRTSFAPRLQWSRLLLEQLALVITPILIGLMLGLPLGKHLTKNDWIENFLVSLTSIFFTIPPIALFCLFIPSFGMGQKTIWITLTLYNILVIANFSSTQPNAPVWSSFIIRKLKKLTITNINLSTLAAFFGTGGFGSLISLGLALNDIPLMLRGAIGVAFLAMAVKWIFEGCELVLKKDLVNEDKLRL